jgi:hypothetical protein
MNFRKGDRVLMNREKICSSIPLSFQSQSQQQKMPSWYSSKIYTIVDFDGDERVFLNEYLPNGYGNRIHVAYLKLLKTERKKKLLRLTEL